MSWAMKMAVWGRTSSWGHRRTWKSCSLVCWRSPWAFSLLCPSCNANNSQSPCKRTSKTVLLLSPFARCGQPPQRGCQLPQQQPQPTPLSPLHFTIVTFLKIVLLSNIVGYLLLSLKLFQGLFLHSLHYNNSIWSKRSILLPKDRQRLWTQESQTPHEGWWRRNKSEILQIFIPPRKGILKDLRNDSPSVTHLRSVRVDMGLTARL